MIEKTGGKMQLSSKASQSLVDKVTVSNVARLPCEAFENLFSFVLWQVAREENLSETIPPNEVALLLCKVKVYFILAVPGDS